MTVRQRSRRTSPAPIRVSSPESSPPAAPSRVPYSVIYDLRADGISALRIYFPMGLLIEQLTS